MPPQAAQSQQTSLGELARKARKEKAAAKGKVLENEEVQKETPEEFPAVQARFATPKGWGKPTPNRHIVISPCPGITLPPPPYEPEAADCALAIGTDGPTRDSRANAEAALDGFQAELLAKKETKGQITPWRAIQLGGMPARETILEMAGRAAPRRMRIVVAVYPPTGLVYMVGFLALPEHFDAFAPAMDTVLKSFEPAPTPPTPPRQPLGPR